MVTLRMHQPLADRPETCQDIVRRRAVYLDAGNSPFWQTGGASLLRRRIPHQLRCPPDQQRRFIQAAPDAPAPAENVAGCAGAQVGIWAAAVGEISGQASLHAVGTASVQWLAPPDPLRCAPWLTARSCRESRSARLNKKAGFLRHAAWGGETRVSD
jgi:hypothetical protein